MTMTRIFLRTLSAPSSHECSQLCATSVCVDVLCHAIVAGAASSTSAQLVYALLPSRDCKWSRTGSRSQEAQADGELQVCAPQSEHAFFVVLGLLGCNGGFTDALLDNTRAKKGI